MKKILFVITILISVFIINNLIHSISALWQKRTLLVEAQSSLEKEKKENQNLKTKLSFVEQPEFVEKEARNKLFLSKPGETKIIIPNDIKDGQKSLQNKKQIQDSNWRKWLELFNF